MSRLEELQQIVDRGTLARFESEQIALDALCAERQLETDEVFAPNDWYGMATVLKAYARFPHSRPLKVLLPHGVYHDDHLLVGFERLARVPAVLAFEPYRLPLYARDGVIAVPFSAPFCYANRLVRYRGQSRGTLFFPVHSTQWLTISMDWEAVADSAAALDSAENPVSVMIYWRDYLLGHHRPFVDRGLRLVSAGHIHDPDFLLRQAYLLQSCARVATNGLGSHVYYAAHVGRPTQIIHHEYRIETDNDEIAREQATLSPERARVWDEVTEAFTVEGDALTESQKRISAYYLSADRILEPEPLAELLLWADRLDRFGSTILVFAGTPKAAAERAGRPRIVPFAFERWLRRLEVRLRRIVERTIHRARTILPVLRRVKRRRKEAP